jgi:hypothetical protein
LEQWLLDEDTRSHYLNRVSRSEITDRFGMGRNALFGYAFDTIAGEPTSLAFGFGLGSWGGSDALGVVGSAYEAGRYRRGSNLVVLIQELGVFGLLAAGGFLVWVTLVLYRDIRRQPLSKAAGLRYGLLLFSLLWPLLFWYKRPLESRATMWLYWVALGYVMNEANEPYQDMVPAVDTHESSQGTVAPMGAE